MDSYGTLFREQAKALRIRELARPLAPPLQRSLSPHSALGILEQSAKQHAYEPTERWSLVMDEAEVIGSIAFYDVATSESGAVGDIATPVRPNDILSGELDALSVVPQLAASSSTPFFVLDRTQLIGTIGYSDLFGAPFRLCLFALTLHLEECALRALLPVAAESIATLSEDRRKKARAVCVMRFGPRGGMHASNLLSGTTFIDKATMLSRMKLVSTISNTRLHDVFVRAEKLRNYCAHPSIAALRTAPILKQEELQRFLADCNGIIEAIQRVPVI